MEPVDHWRAALAAFSDVVAQVGDDQWDAPTMCPDWNARELVDHVAWWQRTTVGQLGLGPAADTPLGDDPATAWTAIRGALEEAVAAEGAMDETMESPFLTDRFGNMMLLPTIDLVFHSWDLAHGLGLDANLPEETCAACLENMLPFDDAIRKSTGAYPDGYDDKIEPPPGANAQTQLLCFGGRQP